MDVALRAIAEADEGPSLSKHLERDGTLEQLHEFVVHRSAYQLKEADPHAWAIPRLHGPPKAALVEIQADEFGGGRAERMHAQLFADAMDALGLDARLRRLPRAHPGDHARDGEPHVDARPAPPPARRDRRPPRAVRDDLRRCRTAATPTRCGASGFTDVRATAFFDEHVEADAVHEAVASVDLAGGLVRQEPELAGDVLWGARALAALEARWARDLLDAWERGPQLAAHPAGRARDRLSRDPGRTRPVS